MADFGSVAAYYDLSTQHNVGNLSYWDKTNMGYGTNCVNLRTVTSDIKENNLNYQDTSTLAQGACSFINGSSYETAIATIISYFNQGTQGNKLFVPPVNPLLIETQPCALGDSTASSIFKPWFYDHNFKWGLWLSNPTLEGGDSTTIYITIDHTVNIDHTYDYTHDYTHLYYQDISYTAIDFNNNLALNKTASAQAYYWNGSQGTPAQAVDGNITGTQWSGGGAGPMQWKVDLGSVNRVGRINLFVTPYADAQPGVGNSRSTYKLQYSLNDIDYTLIKDETDLVPHWDMTYDGDFTARYIKVDNLITPDNQSSWVNIYECKVFPRVGSQHVVQDNYIFPPNGMYLDSSTNIARDATATAQTTFDTHSPSLAINGSTSVSDYWYSNGAGPQWFKLDLGTLKKLGVMKVFMFPANTFSYKISTSTDDTNYTLAVTQDLIQTTMSEFILDCTARYIKIQDIVSPDSQENWIAINEVEVYAYAEFQGGTGNGNGVFPVIGGRHIIQVSQIA